MELSHLLSSLNQELNTIHNDHLKAQQQLYIEYLKAIDDVLGDKSSSPDDKIRKARQLIETFITISKTPIDELFDLKQPQST